MPRARAGGGRYASAADGAACGGLWKGVGALPRSSGTTPGGGQAAEPGGRRRRGDYRGNAAQAGARLERADLAGGYRRAGSELCERWFMEAIRSMETTRGTIAGRPGFDEPVGEPCAKTPARRQTGPAPGFTCRSSPCSRCACARGRSSAAWIPGRTAPSSPAAGRSPDRPDLGVHQRVGGQVAVGVVHMVADRRHHLGRSR